MTCCYQLATLRGVALERSKLERLFLLQPKGNRPDGQFSGQGLTVYASSATGQTNSAGQLFAIFTSTYFSGIENFSANSVVDPSVTAGSTTIKIAMGDYGLLPASPSLRLDLRRRRATYNGAPIPLGPKRFEVLCVLSHSKDGIPENVLRAMTWGQDSVARNIVRQKHLLGFLAPLDRRTPRPGHQPFHHPPGRGRSSPSPSSKSPGWTRPIPSGFAVF